MKIQVISDLHIEFGEYSIDSSQADIIVIAGDVHIGKNGVTWIKKEIPNKPVIYILGNHEYYSNTYPNLLYEIKEITKNSNIKILENEVFSIKRINFLGCTLWTDFNLFGNKILSQLECQFGLNDFTKIRMSPNFFKILPTDIEQIHKKSVFWLNQTLKKLKNNRIVVITHHAPSIHSVPDRFKNKLISSGFASNLENIISIYQPQYWIHGHTHDSFDYEISGCRVICNPKGYPNEGNKSFNRNFIIEI